MSAFDVINPEPSIPVVANIPHSSVCIPPGCRSSLLLSEEELVEEQRAIVDWHTEELYRPIVQAGGTALVSRVSRLVVDTERFDDDSREAMALRGMGVIYERTTERKLLRHPPSSVERMRLLEAYYRPYHRALTALCRGVIDKFGYCLLLDCHSFPESALPYEADRSLFRPDMCLGTDARHSPEELVRMMEEVSARFGWSCARNTPFAGTVVPLELYGDERLAAIMIEYNRRLYMDETTTERTVGFVSAQRWLVEVLGAILTVWSGRQRFA